MILSVSLSLSLSEGRVGRVKLTESGLLLTHVFETVTLSMQKQLVTI